MTAIPEAPPRGLAFARGLTQAFEVTLKLAGLAAVVGEGATVHARFTVEVDSEAEVDGFAAEMGVIAGRPCCGRYQATAREDAVTVTVACAGPDAVPPADAVTIAAVRHMASSEAGRGAA